MPLSIGQKKSIKHPQDAEICLWNGGMVLICPKTRNKFFERSYSTLRDSLWLSGKESACQRRRRGFDPWVKKIPWRRKWQPTSVSLTGKSFGQRSLAAGYSPCSCKESDTIWRQNNNIYSQNWISLPDTCNSHNIVNQLYSNKKQRNR